MSRSDPSSKPRPTPCARSCWAATRSRRRCAGAIRAGRILERHEIWFWEEPLQPHDVAGFRALSAAVDLRIATGESLTRTHEFERLIDAGAVDVVQPDAAQIGISQLVDVARRADRAGMLCDRKSVV